MNDRWAEDKERWLASDLDALEKEEFESRVLNDAEKAEEIYAGMELESALGEAVDTPRRIMKPRTLSWAGALLAATLAFVLLMPGNDDPVHELPLRLRGTGDAGAAIGVEPMGEMQHFPKVFRWRPPLADSESQYRWELYDAQARRRGLAVVADSLLVRPASDTPSDSMGTWRWLVVELKPDGSEGPTSAAVEFVVKTKAEE